MIWSTLSLVRYSLLEFSEASGLRKAHTLVKLASGKGWTRVLGIPADHPSEIRHSYRHIRGNMWEQVAVS